jgi:hypothetical protein
MPPSPLRAVTAVILAPRRTREPSAAFWFGTDMLGRDIYSRVLYGTRVSLAVGFSVALLASLSGLAIGLVSGFVRWADGVIMRVMDGLMSIPPGAETRTIGNAATHRNDGAHAHRQRTIRIGRQELIAGKPRHSSGGPAVAHCGRRRSAPRSWRVCRGVYCHGCRTSPSQLERSMTPVYWFAVA